MSKTIQSIKGMNDALPIANKAAPIPTPVWLHFEAVVRDWLAAYGYEQMRTPVLEYTALFVRGVGEHTDIVEKEMYSFEDSLNGDQLVLRPEGTAGCVRACIEHGLLYNQTQRLWYTGPMFRHERPQKGRYRQFHQVGVEAFGFAGAEVDAELIAMLADLWQRLGLTGLQLELNSLGDVAERAAHRAELIAYLEKHVDILDEDGKRRLYTNPLRVLDTKNPALQEMAENAPRLADFLGEESRAHFARVRQLLDDAGIAYTLNDRLVRGLDYYNRTVFEWTTSELGAQATVAAGGRYDGLVEQLGGKPCPGVGFGIGIERLLLLLEVQGINPPASNPDVYLINDGDAAGRAAFGVARALRAAGLKVVLHAGGGSFKSQFKKADASGARYAVVIGESEAEAGTANLKRLTGDGGGEQITLPQAGLAAQILAAA
ncbi:histidyl-tRNA synthetase [Andreprevotia lacus DSM 23236]|jgi:histidyl-tRNA synthetase|uniref:Histidine--tRNA ligase n=1 Tax=Andreprevotia lacus DSM 23236 TaxID=1121001 RepID=A0A1W1XM50_9NEIS|nr:histidine--tRNA ligase [Andreprevotia lacus]SMC24897.1 histidyl-tRNA synthetase [Andreprevotia lacus DSM 23236]